MKMYRVKMAGIVHLPDSQKDKPNWRDDRHFEKTICAANMNAAEQLGFRFFEQRAKRDGWEWVNIFRSWVYKTEKVEPEVYDNREWSFTK